MPITLVLATQKNPDGSKLVQIILTDQESLQIAFSMNPEAAEATGKALINVAIQARTGLHVPAEGNLLS